MLYDGMPIKAAILDSHEAMISWTVSDVCNYSCSYCGDLSAGKSRLPRLNDTIKENVRRLYADFQAANPNKQIRTLLTGGEPTVYPDIVELLALLKECNSKINVITNGSRTIRWWKDLWTKTRIDRLIMSYHNEYTNIDHLIEVGKIAISQDIPISYSVMIPPSKFNEMMDIMYQLQRTFTNDRNVVLELGIIRYQGKAVEAPVGHYVGLAVPYTHEQKREMEHFALMHRINRPKFSVDARMILKQGFELVDGSFVPWDKTTQTKLEGDWAGYMCQSHNHFLQIDQFGRVGRQTCGQHVMPLTNIWEDDFIENLQVNPDPVMCTRSRACGCSALTKTPKYKNPSA